MQTHSGENGPQQNAINRSLLVWGCPWEIIFGGGWGEDREREVQSNFLAELIFSSPSSLWRGWQWRVITVLYYKVLWATKRSGEMWHFKLFVTKLLVFDKDVLLDLKCLAASFLAALPSSGPFLSISLPSCIYVSSNCSALIRSLRAKDYGLWPCPTIVSSHSDTDIPSQCLHMHQNTGLF